LGGNSTYEPNVFVDTVFGDGVQRNVDGFGLNASFDIVTSVSGTSDGGTLLAISSAMRPISLTDGFVGTRAATNWQSILDGRVAVLDAAQNAYLIVSSLNVVSIAPSGIGRALFSIGTSDGPYFTAGMSSARLLSHVRNDAIIVVDANRFRRIDVKNQTIKTLATNASGTSNIVKSIQVTPDGFVLSDFGHRLRFWSENGFTEVTGRYNGTFTNLDGPVATALFDPDLIDISTDGSIFFTEGPVVRRLKNGIVTTLAGSSFPTGHRDGPGIAAQFSSITSLFSPSPNVIYLSESGSYRIRRILIGAEIDALPLNANLFAGVRITGTIGRTYRIECSEGAEGPDWQTVDQITLTKSPQTWFDENPAVETKRFYRAILLPL
jgi:hypothetical protein